MPPEKPEAWALFLPESTALSRAAGHAPAIHAHRTIDMKNFPYEDELIKKVRGQINVAERFLGFTDRPAPPSIRKKIETVMEEVPRLLEVFYNYKIAGDEIYILYSVGDKFEKRVDELLRQGQAMNALIMDKLGVICLDAVRSLIFREVAERYHKSPDKIYYPGSRDYGIEAQTEIYEMMETGYIRINAYHQLYPIKTVALKATLRDEPGHLPASPCESCDCPCEMRGQWNA